MLGYVKGGGAILCYGRGRKQWRPIGLLVGLCLTPTEGCSLSSRPKPNISTAGRAPTTPRLRLFGDSRPWVAARYCRDRSAWLDGVGQAGIYGRAERMNGRTRLHRCREGIPVNNSTGIEGVVVRIGSRGQDTKCVAIS